MVFPGAPCEGHYCSVYTPEKLRLLPTRVQRSSLPMILECITAPLSRQTSQIHSPLAFRSQFSDTDIPVYCHGTALPQADSATYLGVIVDNFLSWHSQINAIAKKVACKTLWRARLCGALDVHSCLSCLSCLDVELRFSML